MKARQDRDGEFRWDLTMILMIGLILTFLALLILEIGPLDHVR